MIIVKYILEIEEEGNSWPDTDSHNQPPIIELQVSYYLSYPFWFDDHPEGLSMYGRVFVNTTKYRGYHTRYTYNLLSIRVKSCSPGYRLDPQGYYIVVKEKNSRGLYKKRVSKNKYTLV
jgi:hypothetical protein